MAFIKNICLLLASIAICSALEEMHDSIVLTNVGHIQNTTNGVKEITCEVLRSKRNVEYNIESKAPELIYDSTDYYPYQMYMNSSTNRYDFAILKYRSANDTLPATFDIAEQQSHTSISFEIRSRNITLRFRNSTNEYNDVVESPYILPLNVKVGFYIELSENTMSLGHNDYGILIFAYINATSELTMTVHNGYDVAPAEWYFSSTESAINKINVDKYETNCWDSSNKNNNDTGNSNKTVTDFTIMIEAQYKFNQTMWLDLYKLKFMQDNEATREYLNQYYSDIKDNYVLSKELHKKIIRSNRLSQYEVTVKNKYLRNNIFLQIREMYFELVKVIEFNLSKFK